MTSNTQTTMAIGTSGLNAEPPIKACESNTTRISSVAYAVDDNASDAKTGNAISLRSRWCCASVLEIGRPTRIRFNLGTTAYLGPVTITATVEGGTSGTAVIQITP